MTRVARNSEYEPQFSEAAKAERLEYDSGARQAVSRPGTRADRGKFCPIGADPSNCFEFPMKHIPIACDDRGYNLQAGLD